MSKRKRPRRPTAESIAATEAAKNFGRLVDRVREEGATYETLRHIEEAVATHNRPAVPRNPWER